jgi:predicted RNase H-like nuclease (RuvC/YqgF family)
MQEHISDKLLSQNSENVQKLFDLTTRIDERVILLQNKEEQLDDRIDGIFQKNIELIEKMASLETSQSMSAEHREKINELDRRLSKLEDQHGAHNERWKSLANFMIQLVWVILAAYLLTKLNLQSPSVP